MLNVSGIIYLGSRATMLDNAYFDLPEHIVFEILLRLSITSLSRFKCVCKHWYDVIESHDFREQHFELQHNSALFITVNYIGAAHYYQPKICSGKNLRIVKNVTMPVFNIRTFGPCRGLFLMCNGSDARARLGLFNLATKAFRLLPRPKMPHNISDSQGFITYGLGWCPHTNDYKVVCLLYRHQAALIYRLSTDSWQLLDSPTLPNLDEVLIFSLPWWNIHINGFCYWLPVFQEPPRLLVSFDVVCEVFKTILLPPDVTDVKKGRTLSRYYDSLALLAAEKGGVEVWVLQQERQQQHYFWTKIFNCRHTFEKIRACGIWNNTHILLKKCMLHPSRPNAQQLVAYI